MASRTNQYLGQILALNSSYIQSWVSLTSGAGAPGLSTKQYAIGDILYWRNHRHTTIPKFMFVVFDIGGAKENDKYLNYKEGRKKFGNFLSFVRTMGTYHDDYWFNTNLYAVVFKIPEKYKDSFSKFLISRYSEMYSQEDLRKLGYYPTFKRGNKEYENYRYLVFTKNPKGQKLLKKEIEERFGTNVLPENPQEYDLPWAPDEEILNYHFATSEEVESIKKQRGITW